MSSNLYTVSANYTTGNDREQTMYECESTLTSKLVKAVTSTEFVWNDANIQKFVNGQRVSVVLSFGFSIIVDIAVTKGIISGALATTLSVTTALGDFVNAGAVADTKTIISTPIRDWGYSITYTPHNGGYTRQLNVYDNFNVLHETVKLSNVSASGISYAVR